MDICFIVHKIIQYYHLLVTQILPSLTIGDRLPFDRTTYFLNSFLLLTQENDPRSSCIFFPVQPAMESAISPSSSGSFY